MVVELVSVDSVVDVVLVRRAPLSSGGIAREGSPQTERSAKMPIPGEQSSSLQFTSRLSAPCEVIRNLSAS